MIQNLLFFLFLFFDSVVFATNSDTLHFKWLGDSINGVYYEKSSIIIPVHVLSDTSDYYFQFDTGANSSSVYTGREHGISPVKPISLSGKHQTNLGTLEFDTLTYMSPFIEQGNLIIGTIGANILKDKLVQVDFENQTIIISNDLNSDSFSFHPMTLSYGRPVINLQFGNSEYNFLFDTGSSIFELWTTKKIWKQTTNINSPLKELQIWSWGQLNTVYSKLLSCDTFLFECKNFKLNSVSYSSNKMYQKHFKEANVDGIIGVKPFLNKVILLDFRSMQIGIMKCT